MTYAVVWKPTAEGELAEVWMNASDRTAVAVAAHRLETVLRTDAHEAGESRLEATRILFEAPLGITVHVDEVARIASVIEVWRFRGPTRFR